MLIPITNEMVSLPSREVIEVPKTWSVFVPWIGESVSLMCGNETILVMQGEAVLLKSLS